MRGKTIFAVGLAASLLSSAAFAQERPGPLVLSTHPLKGGVYWTEGGRSNTGFIVGDKGVIAIDSQTSEEAGKADLAEIAKVTPKPVDALIITHGDPDHVGGIPAFPAATRVIVQENVRAAIRAAAADPAGGGPVYAAMYRKLLAHLPTETIGATTEMTIDGVRMVLMHVAPGHSTADLMIYLPDRKIVFAGDVLTTSTGLYPVIHTGGSSLGWIEAMKAILALNADIYVPGHGPIESRAQIEKRLHDVETRRAQIKTMVNADKSLEEVKQALPDAGTGPMFASFTETTFNELTNGYPRSLPPWVDLNRRAPPAAAH